MIRNGNANQNDEDVFYVKDNGVGIKKQFHEKIFGLFDKTGFKRSRASLAIVKRIIEVHGGRIRINKSLDDIPLYAGKK